MPTAPPPLPGIDKLEFMGVEHSEVIVGVFRHEQTIETAKAAHCKRLEALRKHRALLESLATADQAERARRRSAAEARRRREEVAAAMSGVIRGATERSGCLVHCYFCASRVLHQDYAAHVKACMKRTEAMLRRLFYNPLRAMPQPPEMSLPPEDDAAALAEFNMQCAERSIAARLRCVRCDRRFFIHELEPHSAVCIGRGIREVGAKGAGARSDASSEGRITGTSEGREMEVEDEEEEDFDGSRLATLPQDGADEEEHSLGDAAEEGGAGDDADSGMDNARRQPGAANSAGRSSSSCDGSVRSTSDQYQIEEKGDDVGEERKQRARRHNISDA